MVVVWWLGVVFLFSFPFLCFCFWVKKAKHNPKYLGEGRPEGSSERVGADKALNKKLLLLLF